MTSLIFISSLFLLAGCSAQGVNENTNSVEISTYSTDIVRGEENFQTPQKKVAQASVFVLTCSSWNEERQNGSLVLEDSGLVSKSENASLLAAYIRGVIDVTNKVINSRSVKSIDRICKTNPQSKIVDVVLDVN